jgi:hypothetical protein
MADREKERAARNRDFIAQMAAPPTQARLLAELQLEITDAVQLAVALNFPSVVRLLQDGEARGESSPPAARYPKVTH